MVLAHVKGIIEVDNLHDFVVQYRNDSRFKEAINRWCDDLYHEGIYIDDIIDAGDDGIDGYVDYPDLELEKILKIADDVYILENKEPYGYRIIEVDC